MEAAARLMQTPVGSESLNRQIWSAANLMRAGGFNTLDTIEHLTLLLFLRLLADPPPGSAAIGPLGKALGGADPLRECRGSPQPAATLNEKVYPAVRSAVSTTPPNHPAHVITDGFQPRIEDDRLLSRLLDLVGDLPLDVPDVNGAIYEHLIGTLSEAGHLGQYFTPRHIVDLMVALVAPRPGETIYDPAVGTGGFLIGAARAETELGGTAGQLSLHGHEINRTVRRLCVMNLLIRGLDADGIQAGDALAASATEAGTHDIVLTNPPFGSSVEPPDDPTNYPIAIKSSEGLFLQHILTALKPGGRAAVVCPEGLLANTGPSSALRKHLMEQAQIDGVLSLPAGVFNPYTAVRTGILLFTKGEPTRRIWFFDVRADGFALDARRKPTGQSDLPAALENYARRAESSQSVSRERSAIREHNERLVASRYLHDARRPRGGGWIELGEVCRLRKESIAPADTPDEPFAYVALEHIEPKTGGLLPIDPTPGAEIRSTKTKFQSGDVLYGKLRPYLAKVWLAAFDGICSTELVVLEPDRDKVLAGYLAEILRSESFTEGAVALMVGANHPRIHPNDLLAIPIPLPPVAEQEQVVEAAAVARVRIEDARRQIAEATARIQQAGQAAWG